MPRLQRKNFANPDQVRRFDNGRLELAELDETTVGRFVFDPGWHWSRDVAPHTGEVEVVGGQPRGVAVHAAARVAALAVAGEVLVSATTRDLLDGSGLMFEDRGVHELKGLTGARSIFALVRG